jgi:hypothetical protein
MKIFKIKNDSNNIPRLIPVVNRYHKYNCESKIKDWGIYEVYNADPIKKMKNFFTIGTASALVFDEHTLEICQTVFEMAGEILPIKVERGPDLYLLNVLECMNGINYDTTVWDYYNDGTKGRILKYGFHPERVLNEASIFKIPEDLKTNIFCYADVKNPDDEFYHLYHIHKLTGLIFEELYNDGKPHEIY